MPSRFLKKPALAVVALTTLAAGGAAVLWHQRPIPVKVAKVWRGDAVELVYATGFVEPDQPAALSSRVTAPVIAVGAEEGDRVVRGQPLVVLDGGEQQGLLAQADAERRGAELAERRTVTLYQQGWMTRAARDQAALQLSYTVLTAPADGVVSKKSAEPGQLVQAGQPLMTVVPLADVWVVANLKETQVRDVVPGDSAEIHVDAYPGRTFLGVVESISPATGAKFSLLPPDNATGNFTKVVQRLPVKIRFAGPQDNGAVLRPGMSVNVTIATH